jgi:recombination protein RecT
MTTATATTQKNPADSNTSQPSNTGRVLTIKDAKAEVQRGLEQMRPQFQVVLPSQIKPEAFERVVMTAVNNDPSLLLADRHSFYLACIKAAQDGLLPDKKEGAFVLYNDEKSKKKMVQWMPMVGGIVKKIMQSGQVHSVVARVVYQKEIDEKRFSFVVSDGEEKLFHDPMFWGDRGPKVLVYATAKFKDGTVVNWPMHKDDVMKRKAMSKAQNGPWKSWETEMWIKTAIRGLAPKLPISSEALNTINDNREPTEFERMKREALQSVDHAAGQFAIQGPDEMPLDEVEGEEVGEDEIVHEDSDHHRQAQNALLDAMAGLDAPELRTAADVEEYAEKLRTLLRGEAYPITDEERAALLGRWQSAVLTKTREVLKTQRSLK